MAQVAVIMKVIPGSPEANFEKITKECVDICKKYSNSDLVNVKEEPLAFGLKSILLNFLMEESIGDTEPLEAQLAEVDGVQTVETSDVRRAFG
jgi:translation elongation factor aEF-1 beta